MSAVMGKKAVIRSIPNKKSHYEHSASASSHRIRQYKYCCNQTVRPKPHTNTQSESLEKINACVTSLENISFLDSTSTSTESDEVVMGKCIPREHMNKMMVGFYVNPPLGPLTANEHTLDKKRKQIACEQNQK
jgi:hypothetical protein